MGFFNAMILIGENPTDYLPLSRSSTKVIVNGANSYSKLLPLEFTGRSLDEIRSGLSLEFIASESAITALSPTTKACAPTTEPSAPVRRKLTLCRTGVELMA